MAKSLVIMSWSLVGLEGILVKKELIFCEISAFGDNAIPDDFF
jgi:hypothetical protein